MNTRDKALKKAKPIETKPMRYIHPIKLYFTYGVETIDARPIDHQVILDQFTHTDWRLGAVIYLKDKSGYPFAINTGRIKSVRVTAGDTGRDTSSEILHLYF